MRLGEPANCRIVSVSRHSEHRFSKTPAPSIELVAGIGVLGDAHAGETVRHRSRVARDPTQPNLRQVHLIHAELLDELAQKGFSIAPGDLGENVLTRGIDLLALPSGTVLHLGEEAVIEITGLRNPCAQIEAFRSGVLAEVVGRDAAGRINRKCGVMAVVVADGVVQPGDAIKLMLPTRPHRPLEVV